MKKSSIVLGSLMGLAVTVTAVSAAFTDVKQGDWFYNAVTWGQDTKLIEGYQDGTFKPHQTITRAETSVLFYRYDEMMKKKMDAMETKLTALEKKVTDLEKMIDEDSQAPAEEKEMYYSVLSGDQEVPTVDTDASGTAKVWVEGGKLMYEIDVKDLSGAVTSAAIHMGEAGQEGNSVHTITFNGNSADGSWDFSDADWENLKDGKYYININTAANAEGEIRGQIFPQMYMAELNGDNEVPAVDTDGTGTAKLWIENGKLMYEVTVKDLSTDITGAHIHMGAEGENGDAKHEITFDGMEAEGSWTLTEEDWMALAEGELYVNVHTEDHTDGEIRGQIEPDFL